MVSVLPVPVGRDKRAGPVGLHSVSISLREGPALGGRSKPLEPAMGRRTLQH